MQMSDDSRPSFQTPSTWSSALSLSTLNVTLVAMMFAFHHLSLIRCSEGVCVFPDFVQSNVSSPYSPSFNNSSPMSSPVVVRDWRTRITAMSSGGSHFGARVLIDGGLMRVITNPINDSASPLTAIATFQSRLCVQTVDGLGSSGPAAGQPTLGASAALLSDRKYIVIYRERNTSSSVAASSTTRGGKVYQCIQFVRRTDAIFQIRASEMSARQDVGLCNSSSMKQLDVWLIVDRSRLLTQSVTTRSHQNDPIVHLSSFSTSRCPSILDGGFSVRLHHPPPPRSTSADAANTSPGCANRRPLDARLEQRCFIAQRPDNDRIKLVFRPASDGLYCGSPTDLWLASSESTPINSSKTEVDAVVGLSCIAEWLSVELQYWYVIVILHSHVNQQPNNQAHVTHPLPVYSSVWTMRLPTRMRRLEDSFTAHLFSGAIAPSTPSVSFSDDRHVLAYRLDTVRNPPRPVTSLCLDDDDDGLCQVKSAAALAKMCADTPTATRCARTCGICNATRPIPCSLESSWHGVWRDVTASDDVTIHVNQTAMSVMVDRRRFVDMLCVNWQPQPSGTKSKGSTSGGGSSASSEAMFVVGRGDGCLPYYICVRLQRRSPSIAYVRYSRAITWPFRGINSVDDPIDCRLFTFDHSPGVTTQHSGYPQPPANNPVVGVLDPTRHWRVLYTADERSPVPCRLPDFVVDRTYALPPSSTPPLTDFKVLFPDGKRCSSGRVEMIQSGLALRVTLDGCVDATEKAATDVGQLSFGAYSCLLSTSLSPDLNNKSAPSLQQIQHHPTTDHVIWTRAQPLYQTSSSVAGVVHCWLFRGASSEWDGGSFHVIDAAQCPTELFTSQRRRADEWRQRPSSAVIFSKHAHLLDDVSSTIDSLSSLNRRRTENDRGDVETSYLGPPSRTKHGNDDKFPSVKNTDTSGDDDNVDRGAGGSGAGGGEEVVDVHDNSELVIAVSVIVFILCSYVPCIYRSI